MATKGAAGRDFLGASLLIDGRGATSGGQSLVTCFETHLAGAGTREGEYMRECATCEDAMPCEACDEGRRLASEGWETLRALDGGYEVALPLAPVLACVAGPVADVPWTLTAQKVKARAVVQLVLW